MAEQQKPKVGLLARRREKKREKVQKKADLAAAQRGEHAAGAERATHGWYPEGGGS